jgi:SAM-dependent methyltransferase
MKYSFIQKLIGDRLNPSLLHPSRFTLLSIKKFISQAFSEYETAHWWKLRVLDFWCWDQPYRSFFHNHDYVGCDIGSSPELNDKYSIIEEGQNLPYQDNFFDVILFTEVMEHLKFPELYATELVRILKKGGIIIMTVPQIWDYHPYPQHFFLYTPDGVNLYFKEKVSQIELYGDTTPFQTWMMIAMMYSDWKIPIIKGIYIFIINLFVLPFPGYREYNHVSSHIFAKMIK